MCEMTHLRVKWLICVWHDSFMQRPPSRQRTALSIPIFFMCDMTHLLVKWLIYVWNDSFMCDMTHLWEGHQVDTKQRCPCLFCDFFWKSSIPNCFRVCVCLYLYMYLCLRLCTKKTKIALYILSQHALTTSDSFLERALYIFKRALYILKRALYILHRDPPNRYGVATVSRID